MHNTDPYYCNSCDYETLDESCIQKHIKQVHDSSYDARTFSSQTRNKHRSSKPEDPLQKKAASPESPKSEETKIIEPFYCNSCDYENVDESKMTEHVEQHADMISCTECDEFFTAKDQFDLHMEFYHGKPYQQ